MTDPPLKLDAFRSPSARKLILGRREQVQDFLDSQDALRESKIELEKFLLDAPAKTWPQAGAQALYLLETLTEPTEKQDLQRKLLTSQTINALKRLCASEVNQ